MTTIDRIHELVSEKNISIYKLSQEIGLNKTFFSDWKSGKAKPSAAALSKLADYFDCSIDYLLGRTNVRNVFPNQKELPKNYLPKNAIPLSDYDLYRIPIIGEVRAGIGGIAQEDIMGYEYITHNDLHGHDIGEFFFLEVEGNSMEPELREGDRVLVHKQSSIDSGSLAVVLVDGEEGLIKYVEYGRNWIELLSVNEEYPPRRFNNADVQRIEVVGLVKKVVRVY